MLKSTPGVFLKLARFDKKLVQHTFAYITAAKKGISETELEDVLSLDDRWDFVGFCGIFIMAFPGPWQACIRASCLR